MRAAPPAACALASGGLWWLVRLALPAVSLASLAWALSPWPFQFAAVAGLAAVGLSAWLQGRQPSLELVWNGATWCLGTRRDGRVSLLWDGGRWLLARWCSHGAGAGCWLMLARADAVSDAEWHALRVALVQSADVPPQAIATLQTEVA